MPLFFAITFNSSNDEFMTFLPNSNDFFYNCSFCVLHYDCFLDGFPMNSFFLLKAVLLTLDKSRLVSILLTSIKSKIDLTAKVL